MDDVVYEVYVVQVGIPQLEGALLLKVVGKGSVQRADSYKGDNSFKTSTFARFFSFYVRKYDFSLHKLAFITPSRAVNPTKVILIIALL